MKQGIHPDFKVTKVTCSCGNSFETRSVKDELHVELCNQCHPFYTGKQKLVDTGGRVERFQKKYANRRPAQQKPAEPAEAPEASAGPVDADADTGTPGSPAADTASES